MTVDNTLLILNKWLKIVVLQSPPSVLHFNVNQFSKQCERSVALFKRFCICSMYARVITGSCGWSLSCSCAWVQRHFPFFVGGHTPHLDTRQPCLVLCVSHQLAAVTVCKWRQQVPGLIGVGVTASITRRCACCWVGYCYRCVYMENEVGFLTYYKFRNMLSSLYSVLTWAKRIKAFVKINSLNAQAIC